MNKLLSKVSVAVLLGCTAVAASAEPQLKHASEYVIDGKIYGLPEAKVFTEDYDGPAIVGDYVSALPHLEPLTYAGNREHHVRMDVVAQRAADGVR